MPPAGVRRDPDKPLIGERGSSGPMAACPGCGLSTEASWTFCASCGSRLRPAYEAPAVAVHLDDVLYNCQRCGKEARFGELPRCVVCKESMCAECVETCGECEGVVCRNDVVACHACKAVGCARCYVFCETCEVKGLCPDHELACGDCGYPTCEGCMGECKRCGFDVCSFCLEAHKTEKR